MSRKSKQELSKMHWRDRYEYEAGQEFNSLDKLNERELVEKIEKNHIGSYFAIWRVIARKGTPSQAAMPMWRYLQRSPGERNMHNRYHCAAALFQILGRPDPASESDLRKQVQWDSHGEEARQQALLKLKAIIEEIVSSGA
jgi:hypothetical protein